MNNLHIQYFLEVARLKSFTKASEKLYVSQPSISRQISNLEKELDLVLFDRTKKTTQLTEAGEMMYRFFSETAEAFEQTRLKAQNSMQGIHGVVRIGLPTYFSNFTLWNTIYSQFTEKFPNVKLYLSLLPTDILIEKFVSDELDIIIGYQDYLANNPKCVSIPLMSSVGYLFLHKNNPLASQQKFSLHNFADQKMYTLLPSVDPIAKEHMLDFCRSQGFEPRIVEEAINTETLLFNLAKGDGYTFFTEWQKPQDTQNYSSFPVNHVDTHVLYYKRETPSDAVHLFANEIQFLARYEEQSI